MNNGLRGVSKIGVCQQNQTPFFVSFIPKTFAGKGIASCFILTADAKEFTEKSGRS